MTRHISFAFGLALALLSMATSQPVSATPSSADGDGDASQQVSPAATTRPSANIILDAILLKCIRADNASGVLEVLRKRLPQVSVNRINEMDSPDKVVYGFNSQLRWIELFKPRHFGDCECMLLFFTPNGRFVDLQDMTDCKLQKEPKIVSDSQHMFYMITCEETGTEVCCSWVELFRAPVRDPVSKEWHLPKSEFRGQSNGYVGEWMSTSIMQIVFPKSYKRSNFGDGQLLNFAIDYKLICDGPDSPIVLHRSGFVSLSDIKKRETAKAIVNERFIYAADADQMVPLF